MNHKYTEITVGAMSTVLLIVFSAITVITGLVVCIDFLRLIFN